MDAGENNKTHKNKIHHNRQNEEKKCANKAKYVFMLIEYIVSAYERHLRMRINVNKSKNKPSKYTCNCMPLPLPRHFSNSFGRQSNLTKVNCYVTALME